jgi:hypothetical protein
MNKILLFLFLSLSLFAQTKNKLTKDEDSGQPMLIGICDRSAFSDTSFSAWFNDEYDRYKPDSARIDSIKNKITNFKITIVMGTWCSDSQREVPRIYKILDKLNFDSTKITLLCVNQAKKDPNGEAENLAIKFVPTIIFTKDDLEKGRIVELPQETLEKDMLKIVR